MEKLRTAPTEKFMIPTKKIHPKIHEISTVFGMFTTLKDDISAYSRATEFFHTVLKNHLGIVTKYLKSLGEFFLWAVPASILCAPLIRQKCYFTDMTVHQVLYTKSWIPDCNFQILKQYACDF